MRRGIASIGLPWFRLTGRDDDGERRGNTGNPHDTYGFRAPEAGGGDAPPIPNVAAQGPEQAKVGALILLGDPANPHDQTRVSALSVSGYALTVPSTAYSPSDATQAQVVGMGVFDYALTVPSTAYSPSDATQAQVGALVLLPA